MSHKLTVDKKSKFLYVIKWQWIWSHASNHYLQGRPSYGGMKRDASHNFFRSGGDKNPRWTNI